MYLDKNRPRKRKCQLKLREKLNEKDYQNGTMVVLCGPNPNKAIKHHKNLYKDCVLVENNLDVWREAKKIYENINDQTITLRYDDIFNVVNCRTDKVTGIDFDFCNTLTDNSAKQIINSILGLQQNKVWIRITTSYRMMPKKILKQRQNLIISIIEKYSDFKVIDEESEGYNEYGPMNVWQIQLEKN